MLITGETLIGQVLDRYPASLEVFEQYGLPCAACLAYTVETIEVGARRHGVDTNRLVADLNRLAGAPARGEAAREP